MNSIAPVAQAGYNPGQQTQYEPGDLAEVIGLGFQIEVTRVIKRDDGGQCVLGHEIHSGSSVIISSEYLKWVNPAQINLFGTWE